MFAQYLKSLRHALGDVTLLHVRSPWALLVPQGHFKGIVIEDESITTLRPPT